MSTIRWNNPPNVIRGVVIEGIDDRALHETRTKECWERLAALSQSLAHRAEAVSVTCEIWPDTGRIIWIMKDQREFCRIALSWPQLEHRYCEISASERFEYEYQELVNEIKTAVRRDFALVDATYAKRVVLRDSDDTASEEHLA